MKKKVFRRKGFRALAAVFMSLLLLLGVVQAAAASEDSGSGRTTGSLSLTLAVTEKGKQVPLTDVPLALYQVASMDTEPVSYFHMASSLSGTGVDLNNLKTAADAESASKILANAVGAAGIVPLTGTTDGNGNLSFNSLPKGVYLLVQTGRIDYCRVSPMLVSVPYTSDGLTFEYDVQAFPKAEKTQEEEKRGSLSVTKQLYTLDQDTLDFVEICAADATYYVRLFLDESATIPYGDVQAIHIHGQSSGTVEYTNLPPGTYYVRETDAEGNPRPLDDSFKDDTGVDVNCMITVNGDDSTSVTFDANADHFDTQEAVVQNVYVKMPDGFYMERLLWIEKKVLLNGEETTTDDTFYATVNEIDPDTGDETKITTIELEQNAKVMVSFQITDLADKDVTHTYRVFESDENGNPIDKSTFAYEVGGEGNVSFVGEDDEKTITITNSIVTQTPTPTPTPEETPTPTPEITPGVTPGITPGAPGETPPTTSQRVRTGDNTPIVMWMVILFVAAAAVGFVIARKKKK